MLKDAHRQTGDRSIAGTSGDVHRDIERISLVELVSDPLGILGVFMAIFLALAVAALRWGVDSRRVDRNPEWWGRC